MTDRVALTALLFSLLGCGDRSITRGADGEREWSRHLAAAVPLGTPAESAQATMERNGFQCRAGRDSVAYLWCAKMSSTVNVVRRRWQAVLNLDQGRVFEVRASTGLIGP
jgi:hypothetical protein